MWKTQAESLEEFIIENSAGARAAYNWAGMGVYDEHPWLGVGLGASGFYMYDNLPDWALTTVPEIARQLDPSNRLYPNPKNMYVRILAEAVCLAFAFPGLFVRIAGRCAVLFAQAGTTALPWCCRSVFVAGDFALQRYAETLSQRRIFG